MSASELFGLSLRHPLRSLRRWKLAMRLFAIGREIDLIRRDRANGFAVERHLMGQQAILRSDLRNM